MENKWKVWRNPAPFSHNGYKKLLKAREQQWSSKNKLEEGILKRAVLNVNLMGSRRKWGSEINTTAKNEWGSSTFLSLQWQCIMPSGLSPVLSCPPHFISHCHKIILQICIKSRREHFMGTVLEHPCSDFTVLTSDASQMRLWTESAQANTWRSGQYQPRWVFGIFASSCPVALWFLLLFAEEKEMPEVISICCAILYSVGDWV